jgi:hypothetical protein
MVPCKIMNHIRKDDDFGGYIDTWQEGASFDAALAKDSSTQAVIAERQELGEIYRVVTKRSFTLGYHDVFKRVSDGAIFRVTSNDTKSHPASTVKIAKVTAERWELPV